MTITANTAVPSDEDIQNIELLHLVDLNRCFGLNIFPCPAEEVYPVQECNGVKRYLNPCATHKNYQYFKAVKKTQLRASLKQRFGSDIANRVMKRYLAFDYEFEAYCWSQIHKRLVGREAMLADIHPFLIIKLVFLITERSTLQDKRPIFHEIELQSWLLFRCGQETEATSRRLATVETQWIDFVRLASRYPTKWKYHNKNGSPSDLYQYQEKNPEANPWIENPSEV